MDIIFNEKLKIDKINVGSIIVMNGCSVWYVVENEDDFFIKQ